MVVKGVSLISLIAHLLVVFLHFWPHVNRGSAEPVRQHVCFVLVVLDRVRAARFLYGVCGACDGLTGPASADPNGLRKRAFNKPRWNREGVIQVSFSKPSGGM